MADEQAVYEAIAQKMRQFGYSDVTAEFVREIDYTPEAERTTTVVWTFAGKQLQDAHEEGRLPPRG